MLLYNERDSTEYLFTSAEMLVRRIGVSDNRETGERPVLSRNCNWMRLLFIHCSLRMGRKRAARSHKSGDLLVKEWQRGHDVWLNGGNIYTLFFTGI